MKTDDAMLNFDFLLEESVKVHGHLCPGQVLGVRMSLLGLREIGIQDPRSRDKKNLVVFVEMDRCATDAIQSVTGCSLGRRTMKFMDYGKMAATFVNLRTGKAVRVSGRDDARERARAVSKGGGDKYAEQIAAYKVMSEDELFATTEVEVQMRPEDMPGRPMKRVTCDLCREDVQDMREVYKEGKVLCRSCAGGGYYMVRGPFLLPAAMHKCHNDMEIKSKLWIEVNGEPVFGRGRLLLLEEIRRHGSINRAAREVSISYRKAWGYVKAMEERLGIRLVARRTGGKNGGGATLTHEAVEFLERYEQMEKGVREIVDERFRKVFGAKE
jgi:formylmethanofuran dehydrogenase subunit E